jgi:hypothetical protein
MAAENRLRSNKKLDKLDQDSSREFLSSMTNQVEGAAMTKCEEGLTAKDADALARDVSRFRTLYPNGEAKLRENPTKYFGYLNSAEMVAMTKAA